MENKKKVKKLIIILVIIAAVIVVAVVAVKKFRGGNSGPVSTLVQMQEVEKKNLSDTIALSGSVTGETKINYNSNVESKFLTVNVKVGDEIKKGDVIATLDQETIKKQIASLEKSISNSKALAKNQSDMNQQALTDAKEEQQEQLADAQKLINNTKKDMDEAKAYYDSLSRDGSASSEEISMAKDAYEAAKDAYENAKSSYNSVKKSTDAAIKSAQNTIDMEKYSTDSDEDSQTQLAELKKQLDECTVICEEDGIVTSVNVYEGAYNTPGSTIVTVENNQSMVMTANVDETDILKLQEGMEAIVTAKALGDKELKGEVIKVIKIANGSGSAEGMGGEVSAAASMSGFSVQIRIEPSELISGMTAKAKVFLTQKSDVLCVPYDVVREDENGQMYVLVGEDNGDGTYTAVKKSVTLGEEVNYYVEVTSGDIAEGDYVILDIMVEEGQTFEGAVSMNDMAVDGEIMY
ncbi:MAG: efflux RND transporter periplasmic adaptor subunit [Agathobacter sp.]